MRGRIETAENWTNNDQMMINKRDIISTTSTYLHLYIYFAYPTHTSESLNHNFDSLVKKVPRFTRVIESVGTVIH